MRFLVAVLVPLLVEVAQAEEPASGPRVRLTAPSVSGKRLVGIVVGLDETTLTLQRQGVRESLQERRAAITKIETSRRRSQKGRGAAIGALLGLGAAVVVGLAAGENCGLLQGDDFGSRLQRSFCFDKGETAVLSGILTVPTGILLGLVAAPGEK